MSCTASGAGGGRRTLPIPRNTARGASRRGPSKDVTRSRRVFLSPQLLAVSGAAVLFCSAEEQRPRLYRLSGRKAGERQGPGATLPRLPRGTPHPSPSTARGRHSLQPCSPPCFLAEDRTQTFPVCTERGSVPGPLSVGVELAEMEG